MDNLNKIAKVGIKCVEMLHWLCVLLGAIVFGVTLAIPEQVMEVLKGMNALGEFHIYSYMTNILLINIEDSFTLIKIALVAMIILCALMAMIARNVYLIFLTMEGKNKNVEEKGPFQKDVVRMIREIGIFFISMPAISMILSIIARLIVGSEFVELSVDLGSICIGVVVLCLSQVFAYGISLQQEVDGLL